MVNKMRIEHICDLDKIDIKKTKNGILKYKKKENSQFKKAYFHDCCKRCNSMYISSCPNTMYCSLYCSKYSKNGEHKKKKELKEDKLKDSLVKCKKVTYKKCISSIRKGLDYTIKICYMLNSRWMWIT